MVGADQKMLVKTSDRDGSVVELGVCPVELVEQAFNSLAEGR